MLALLLTTMLMLAFNFQPAKAKTIIVPDDYLTIQAAINAASPGDTIYVREGTYYENVRISKPLRLFGQGSDVTIIDGRKTDAVIRVWDTNNVTINEFTIKNGDGYGIWLLRSDDCNITNNKIINNGFGTSMGVGIYLEESNGNNLSLNRIDNNSDYGIYLHSGSNNVISNNTIRFTNRDAGIIMLAGFNNYMYGNVIRDNQKYGLVLFAFGGHKLRNNILTGNKYNIRMSGVTPLDLPGGTAHDIDVSNMVNSKPIYYFVNQQNITITPSTFPDIGYLAIINSTKITLKDVTIETNNGQGVLFNCVTNSTIENICVMNNENGIELYASGGNNILANNLTKNEVAIKMYSESDGNLISGNTISGNGGGIWLDGFSKNNLISVNNVTDNLGGIHLWNSAYNIIKSNYVANNNLSGIAMVWYSDGNTLIGNAVINNSDYGIVLEQRSFNNTLRNNRIAGSKFNFGVSVYELERCINDIDVSNTVDGKPVYYLVNRKNEKVPLDAGYVAIINSTGIGVEGLTLTNNRQGLLLFYTNNSHIRGNNIKNNEISLWMHRSYNNTFSSNNITNNLYGFSMYVTSNNTFHHNNFINITGCMFSYFLESVNVWDDGYPSGGNYWSDYVGVDLKRGPNQDQPGSDGIGDTPYHVRYDNMDRYPLMKPWSPTIKFDPLRDSFGFVNRGFGGFGLDENVISFLDVAEFIINDPVYRLIDTTLPGSTLVMIPLVYTYLRSYHEDILNGHCYGMSYLVARWFNNPTERPGYPDSTVQSLQLDDELHYLIDYAQQSQLLDFYTFVRWFFVTKELFPWSNLKEYQTIKGIVQTGSPTVMGIADKNNNFYHAVVVYQIESSGSIDTLHISDPNKVIETYSFDTTKEDLGINFRIMAMGVTDQDLFDKFAEWLIDSLTLWVHSPVQLHVYDSAGRHVGMDASGNVEIGFEAAFLKTEDSQLVFISKPSDKYTVKLEGIGSGAYNLTLFRATSNKVTSTAKTGTITEGQMVEYEVIVAGDELTLQIPGLFGISWMTWPIFGAFIAAGIGGVITVLIITRRQKLKKMPNL
jgi:parallel beta-helix repeat protein